MKGAPAPSEMAFVQISEGRVNQPGAYSRLIQGFARGGRETRPARPGVQGFLARRPFSTSRSPLAVTASGVIRPSIMKVGVLSIL